MKKRYTFYNIQFGCVGRKWLFKWPDYQFLVECRGYDQALKVARLIAGALKRNDNQLDNLARKLISRLIGQ